MRKTLKTIARHVLPLAALSLLVGCATQLSPQTSGSMQVSVLKLAPGDIERDGLAFLTPSTVTGQEEDRQALALSFFEAFRKLRPEARLMPLAELLTGVNRAGLSADYKHMMEDYRLTGLLDREIVARIGGVTGSRYLAQLKLAGFRQESKNRWGVLGLRIFDTKVTNMRLFLQIWDGKNGAIVWEGAVELTSAYDSISEDTVTFQSTVEHAARQLVERLP